MSLYDDITTYITQEMVEGTLPWQKPWKGGSPLKMPKNGVTGHEYRGVNVPMLWGSAQKHGYSESEWATYKQWSEAGQQVDKGQKGNMIVYYGELVREDQEEAQKIPFLKASYVFNKAQLKGYEPQEKEDKITLLERSAHVDQFIANTGALFEFDETFHASYSPKRDVISMPEPGQFHSVGTQTAAEGYYATALH